MLFTGHYPHPCPSDTKTHGVILVMEMEMEVEFLEASQGPGHVYPSA